MFFVFLYLKAFYFHIADYFFPFDNSLCSHLSISYCLAEIYLLPSVDAIIKYA